MTISRLYEVALVIATEQATDYPEIYTPDEVIAVLQALRHIANGRELTADYPDLLAELCSAIPPADNSIVQAIANEWEEL